ncbi:muscle-specific protein 300 kDa-like [Oratosquilla oratoria]|uniref:muscle-specific protein 300 kDa-like n=1 Tax=Oratosquilla oratoria TaxID=337810 RepID=UPI003F773C86
MTFWQENYGFVKEVYDFRLTKYQEWMDNLESIVAKVMCQNVQYTYKEFKIIQDTLTSLCRDLEKEGMKEWLDLMLEKVAVRVSDETGGSSRDKEFKNQEKKKLQALIERHDKLMPSTRETQDKVEIYARCYSYGDDIKQVMKTLEEMRHLSVKEIHPHNMNMVEEQIEKAEKNIQTVDSQADQYAELLKRGHKLLKSPNVAPFLESLIEKLEVTWKEANEKSKDRLEMLTNASKDWERYDELRNAIIEPLEKLETEYKRYRKYYDPSTGSRKLTAKKATWEEMKASSDEMYEQIKKCYNTIIILAGEDKKEFLDKEIAEVNEKRAIVGKCEKKLGELLDFNDKITKTFTASHSLRDWANPTKTKLDEICGTSEMSPEDRVKEILSLQEQAKEKLPQLDPITAEYKDLLTEEDLEKSETAKSNLLEWDDIKQFVMEVCDTIEKEAASISQDQRYYADYLCAVKEFKPWMDEAEGKVKAPLARPNNIEEALATLESLKEFENLCADQKSKLDGADQARAAMEKHSSAENECEPLAKRWEGVKGEVGSRIEKITVLVDTWNQLKETTNELNDKMSEVPKQDEPNIEDLEKVFNNMKTLYAKKKELLTAV